MNLLKWTLVLPMVFAITASASSDESMEEEDAPPPRQERQVQRPVDPCMNGDNPECYEPPPEQYCEGGCQGYARRRVIIQQQQQPLCPPGYLCALTGVPWVQLPPLWMPPAPMYYQPVPRQGPPVVGWGRRGPPPGRGGWAGPRGGYRPMAAEGCKISSNSKGEYLVRAANGEIIFVDVTKDAKARAYKSREYFETNYGLELCDGVRHSSATKTLGI